MKSRQIESKDKRTVHFLFNANVETKISPFARKLKTYLEGNLPEFEEEEKEKFTEFLNKVINDDLEQGESNPVIFGPMPYFCCELSGGINRLSFSTADDPFCKIAVPKYYPECVVINKEGKVLATVNP